MFQPSSLITFPTILTLGFSRTGFVTWLKMFYFKLSLFTFQYVKLIFLVDGFMFYQFYTEYQFYEYTFSGTLKSTVVSENTQFPLNQRIFTIIGESETSTYDYRGIRYNYLFSQRYQLPLSRRNETWSDTKLKPRPGVFLSSTKQPLTYTHGVRYVDTRPLKVEPIPPYLSVLCTYKKILQSNRQILFTKFIKDVGIP